VFQNSGSEPCPLHKQILVKWEVNEKSLTYITFNCLELNKDGNRCQVDLATCPTEKVIEHIGLGRLRKASEFLYDHPFRRRP
jgi:hypothetical protein